MRTLPFSKNDMAAPFPGWVCPNACGTAAAAAAATPVASTVRLVESMRGSLDERNARADDISVRSEARSAPVAAVPVAVARVGIVRPGRDDHRRGRGVDH